LVTLRKNDARAQRLLGGAVFAEDEQVPPAAGDRLLQLDPCLMGLMGRGQAQERVQLNAEAVGVSAQHGVGELWRKRAWVTCAGRGEGAVARIDGIVRRG
jgi:hypothetical protein